MKWWNPNKWWRTFWVLDSRDPDGGWEPVGREFSGTSDLKPVCGKGCRPALLSTGSGCPAHSAFGKACGRKITGTRDLTPWILDPGRRMDQDLELWPEALLRTLKADPRFMASYYINLTHIVLL
jgi:hypothetical protein